MIRGRAGAKRREGHPTPVGVSGAGSLAVSFSGYLLCCQLELLLLVGKGSVWLVSGLTEHPKSFSGRRSKSAEVVVPVVGTGVWTLRLRRERRE